MATTYLSPLGNEQQSDANGAPLSGGKIFTYAAGTTTPLATYQDNAGSVAQANPIVLNTSGMPANPIWLPAGQAVKMVFTDANGVSSRPTVDNIVGINDPSGISIDQWVIYTGAPSFISATSFSVAGDQRNTFQIGRRVRTANSGGTVYGTITSVAFSTVTTVTVVNDAGVLDAGLSVVSYGLLSVINSAIPPGRLIGVQVITASGTYTPTASAKSVIVEAVGGGGAGGGSQITGGATVSVGGGGSGADYGKARFTSGFSGVTVTIGAGGVAVAGANGGNGGTTSFGALLSVAGGSGGTSLAATAGPASVAGGGGSGVISGANISSSQGEAGGYGVVLSATFFNSGDGGNSVLSMGGNKNNTTPPSGYGGGGGGRAAGVSTGTTSAGANGAPGVVIVYEYA